MPEGFLAAVTELLKHFGLLEGLFVLFFLLMHFWVWSLYKGRLNDRQGEIDRLAKDNTDLRNRLLFLMDKRFGYTQKDPKKKSK